MPPRNPLNEEAHPRESVKDEDVINVRTQRVVRLMGPDGGVREVVTDARDSRPDQNGGYVDAELINVVTDHAGNPLPEDPRSVIISHSGLYITSPDQFATCTSWLHGNRSRNILLGQDGREVGRDRAICSQCDFWLGTIYIVLGILCLGLIVGIWKGTGLF